MLKKPSQIGFPFSHSSRQINVLKNIFICIWDSEFKLFTFLCGHRTDKWNTLHCVCQTLHDLRLQNFSHFISILQTLMNVKMRRCTTVDSFVLMCQLRSSVDVAGDTSLTLMVVAVMVRHLFCLVHCLCLKLVSVWSPFLGLLKCSK